MDETTPPPPPSPEPRPAESAQPAAAADGAGVAPNIAATICAAVPLVGGIVFLVLEKKNAFVRFWAMQSILFGGLLFVVSLLLQLVTFVLTPIPILGWILLFVIWIASLIFWLGWMVAWVISIIKAFSNVEWEIPYLGKLARKQLGTAQPPVA